MIGKDNIQRWYDLVPETLDAHAPARARLPRSTFGGHSIENLAAAAHVQVDSFLGTTNLGETEELYPVLNQVHVTWEPTAREKTLLLRLSTSTPNFDHFSWRFDRGCWRSGNQTVLCWQLHKGENHFEVRAYNTVQHGGRSTEVIAVHAPGPAGWPGDVRVDAATGTAGDTRYRFWWEDYQHPVLQGVRAKYSLDDVIQPGQNDLEKLALLRDWVKSRWDHDQPIVSPPWNVAYFLDRTDKKIESFYCVHYSIAYMQCCLALGIPARLVNLHRGICTAPFSERGYGKELTIDAPNDEHVVNEVWVDDLGKWVMMDVDFDIHYELDGISLNAVEIHQALIAGRLDRLRVCEGPYAWKLKASPDFYQLKLPVYYTHVCIFWRNNHLSDPEGPDPVLHWIDEDTPWMLWWEGEDLRHRPQIIGPVGVSWPYSHHTPVLTDRNMISCWASSDDPEMHWVELAWDELQNVHAVEILWATCWDRYFNSHTLELDAWVDEGWKRVAVKACNEERAIDRITIDETTTRRIRIRQPIGGGSLDFPNRLWIAEIRVC